METNAAQYELPGADCLLRAASEAPELGIFGGQEDTSPVNGIY